jgi:hypothetical protein
MMKPWTNWPAIGLALACLFQAAVAAEEPRGVAVDLSAHRPACGVAVRQEGTRLHVRWPVAGREHGVLVLQLQPDRPLIEELGIAKTADGPSTALLRQVNPVTFLTVGVRDLSAQGWNVFFDNPSRRPHQTFPAVPGRKKVRVESHGRRATVILDGLSAGPFKGDLRFTVYPGCALVHAEAVVSTKKNACAILYDAGLASPKPSWKTVAWLDTGDRWRRVEATAQKKATPVAVRHRAIIAESDGGAVAVFPPPHQYLYPLDFSDNFGLVWHGRGFQKRGRLGVRGPPAPRGRQAVRPLGQRPAGHPAAPGRVLPPEYRPGAPGAGAGAPLHARRPLQEARRLLDLHQPLPR